MKKLSETWKQKKPLAGLTKSSAPSLIPADTGMKRLGRVPISSSTSTTRSRATTWKPASTSPVVKASCTRKSEVPDSSISASFAVDFDADVIKAMDCLEAAAYQTDTAVNRAAPAEKQPTTSTMPTRNAHGGSKSGKRKTCHSGRSSSAKPGLFSAASGNSVLSDSFTPTRSPNVKKRKSVGREGRKDDKMLFTMSFQKGRLLCSASPSPNTGSAADQSLSKSEHDTDRKSSSSDPFVSSKTMVHHKAVSATPTETTSHRHGHLEEDEVQIETEVSPNYVVNQIKKQSGHRKLSLSESRLHSVELEGTQEICDPKISEEGHGTVTVLVETTGDYIPTVGDNRTRRQTVVSSDKRNDCDTDANQKTHLKDKHSAGSNAHASQSLGTDNTNTNRGSFTVLRNERKIQSNTGNTSTLLASPATSKLPLASSDVHSTVSTSASEVCKSRAVETLASSSSTKVPSSFAPHGKHGVSCSNSDTDTGRVTDNKKRSPQPTLCAKGQIPGGHCTDIATASITRAQSISISHNGEAAEGGGQTAESLSLSSWGLPEPVLEAYHSQGITAMFPWQTDCLTTGTVLRGGNLVYSAPTSAGKTMVAELLVLKRVLETRRKALFILPFVSVTREKMISLQRLYQDAGVRVGGFMGSHSPAGGFHSVDIAVCTIEKGNGLVNRLMEENRIGELGVVVIDELHMVGDSNRGYLLELLLTKICYMAHKSKETNQQPVQVIGMSATLPNLDLLATWLNADLYRTDFRPVPLTEHIKVGTTIYDHAMTKVRAIEVKATFRGDEDHIIPLCLETVMGGHSVLIFCPTKVWCEKMAEKIAREFYAIMKNPIALAAYTGETGFVKASEMARLPIDQALLHNVVEQLGRSAVGVDPMLGKVIQYAVAYHHAGLTFDERDIVEGAFRQGLVKILVATSTLSSGVNLPARRVIVRSPMFGGRAMDTLSYRQMAGRAGRKGVDTEGECVLVCKEGEKKVAQGLLRSDLPPVSSCLHSTDHTDQLSRSMKRAILEVVVGGVASTPGDVARYVACTLLSASLPPGEDSTAALITSCLAFLEDNEFVTLHSEQLPEEQTTEKYRPTQLGSAVLASSLSPDEGLAVFAELQKARQCFVLANELHIIYLVTPIYSQEISGKLDWYHFYCLWEKLSPDMRLVARTVGVEEAFLAKAITGRVPSKTAAQARAVAVHRRFYTALALHELVQEVPLLDVAHKYNCNKGQLQSLMQSAATFAGMVTVFCARLGWTNMELLLAQFQQRLTLGVTRELCDLVRIPLLTGTMARMLFNAGYQTVTSIAHASPQDVETVFRKASPFQSNKKQDGESDWEMEQRRKTRCMWLAGRKDVTELEAAVAVIGEAKTIIQQELGIRIDWQGGDTGVAMGGHDSVDMSPSATALTSCVDGSVVLKQPVNTASSIYSKTSPSTDNATPSTQKRKRKSGGESVDSETPVPSQRSRRSLSVRSFVQRRNTATHLAGLKSPPSGGKQTAHKTGSLTTPSPKDVSFFGQVVVSPPPSLKTQAWVGPPRGGSDTSRCDVVACGNVSPTPTPGVQNQRSVRLFSRQQSPGTQQPSLHNGPVHSAELKDGSKAVRPGSKCLNPLSTCTEAATCASELNDTIEQCQIKERASAHVHNSPSDRSDFKEVNVSDNQSDHCNNHVLVNASPEVDDGERTAVDQSVRQPDNTKVKHPKLPQEKYSDVSMSRSDRLSARLHDDLGTMPEIGQTSQKSVSVPVKKEHSRLVPEKPTPVSCKQDPHADEDVDCFDDSLILNTQTDNLLSGRTSDANVVAVKLLDAVKTSTPLVSARPGAVGGNTLSPAGCSQHGVCVARSSAAKGTLPGNSGEVLSPPLVNCTQHSPHVQTGEVVLDAPDVGSPSSHLHHQHHPQALADDDFTQDLFTSQFVSVPGPSEDQKRVSDNTDQKDSEWSRKADPCQNTDAHRHMHSAVDHATDVGCNSDADASAELIAASNYDRVAYTEEGMEADSASTSYQDLDIAVHGANSSRPGACSASLVCEERDPEEREGGEGVRAQGVTGRPSGQDEYDVQEDLAIAANLSDSFSSHIHGSTSRTVSGGDSGGMGAPAPRITEDNDGPVLHTNGPVPGLDTDGFSTSFTASMMEQAFAEDSFCASSGESGLKHAVSKETVAGQEQGVAGTGSTAARDSTVKITTSSITSCQSAPARGKNHREVTSKTVRDSSSYRKTNKHAQSSTSPQNNGDFVPPTPPEEGSASMSSPSVRRTPMRACRNKGQAAEQIGSSSHVIEKKKRKAKEKENVNTEHKSQSVKTSSHNKTVHGADKLFTHTNCISQSANTPSKGQMALTPVQPHENILGNEIPLDLDSPPPSQDCFCVIDVCSNAELFTMFVNEWRSQSAFSISLGCEKTAKPMVPGGGIGSKFITGGCTTAQTKHGQSCGLELPGDENVSLVGLAVSWAGHDAYYISFTPDNSDTDNSLNDTLAAPPCTQSISQEQIIQTVREVLQQTRGHKTSPTVIAYDSKSTYVALARGLGATFGLCQDPQIANWLLDPGAREKALHCLVTNYLPADLPLLEGVGGAVGYGSLGLSVGSAGSGRMRAVVESIVARRLMTPLWSLLSQAALCSAFTNTEMPSVLTLARMELNGIGFSEEECESQKNVMLCKLSALEQEAYALAGHPFSLTSTDDIAQVLYLELQLPVNGDASATKPVRTLGPKRRAPGGRQKSAFGTSKDVLEKLKPLHPLPGILLEWRRISSALTKHVYPLQQDKVWCHRLAMHRIFSQCQLHTATGRVSMTEPNLQNIPKDFDILLPDVVGESPPVMQQGQGVNGKSRTVNSRLQAVRGATPQTARVSDRSTALHTAVSMRHAFLPFPGGVILAADYSQLELRVIAHLSGDKKLISILNNDGDVFKLIAAQWKNTEPQAVTSEERQHAKQICYGMLYGIGAKALGEQIGVDEIDASVFMESFKAKYTGMRRYLRDTVEQCRQKGYVSTITGRRRYLPAITDTNPHAKAQAERQAVNTTVQGSAADIVKAATTAIDQELMRTFPHTRLPHRHQQAGTERPSGAFLVLQLHDELIYEVSHSDLQQVALIIQRGMERTTPLAVPLPVKVKAGPSWGRLEDMTL